VHCREPAFITITMYIHVSTAVTAAAATAYNDDTNTISTSQRFLPLRYDTYLHSAMSKLRQFSLTVLAEKKKKNNKNLYSAMKSNDTQALWVTLR